jgi:hypothetical protein
MHARIDDLIKGLRATAKRRLRDPGWPKNRYDRASAGLRQPPRDMSLPSMVVTNKHKLA